MEVFLGLKKWLGIFDLLQFKSLGLCCGLSVKLWIMFTSEVGSAKLLNLYSNSSMFFPQLHPVQVDLQLHLSFPQPDILLGRGNRRIPKFESQLIKSQLNQVACNMAQQLGVEICIDGFEDIQIRRLGCI